MNGLGGSGSCALGAPATVAFEEVWLKTWCNQSETRVVKEPLAQHEMRSKVSMRGLLVDIFFYFFVFFATFQVFKILSSFPRFEPYEGKV